MQIKTKLHDVEMEQFNVSIKCKLYVTFPESY